MRPIDGNRPVSAPTPPRKPSTPDEPHPSADSARVAWLPPRNSVAGAGRERGPVTDRPPTRPVSLIKDIGRYERVGEEDDYRHRMLMNGLALAVCVFLVAAGIWLANTMAEMRKNQDCVLSG